MPKWTFLSDFGYATESYSVLPGSKRGSHMSCDHSSCIPYIGQALQPSANLVCFQTSHSRDGLTLLDWLPPPAPQNFEQCTCRFFLQHFFFNPTPNHTSHSVETRSISAPYRATTCCCCSHVDDLLIGDQGNEQQFTMVVFPKLVHCL